MASQMKTSKGFVIKLSSETVQKLNEDEKVVNKEQNKRPDNNKQKDETELVTTVKPSVFSSENLKSENNKQDDETESITDLKTSVLDNEDLKSKNILEESTIGEQSNTSESNSWDSYSSYVTVEGDNSIYTDPSTRQRYTWDATNNSWIPKTAEVPGRVYSFENDTHIYTEADGSQSYWDEDKKAWIPRVDEDFLARYQMSYGFVDNTRNENSEEIPIKQQTKKKLDGALKRKSEPQWFDASEETNTKVYVSNLPLDMNEEEFVNLMQKCGLVERDLVTHKMKVKLYNDKETNCFKGDALCSYIKVESVELALNLLDGSDYKGNKIKVERALFQLKGEYNPALKPKKKKKKELEKLKKMQQKLFDWRPEKIIGERSKHERVVIVKNLFHPSDFDNEVQLILDYQQDLREECSKCGEVRKVVIYDRHPEGVAQITMKEPEMADAVIALISGRWFGKRQISAEIWDGRTKYRIAETDADINQRRSKWDSYLEGKEGVDKPKQNEATKSEDKSKSESVVEEESKKDKNYINIQEENLEDVPINKIV